MFPHLGLFIPVAIILSVIIPQLCFVSGNTVDICLICLSRLIINSLSETHLLCYHGSNLIEIYVISFIN